MLRLILTTLGLLLLALGVAAILYATNALTKSSGAESWGQPINGTVLKTRSVHVSGGTRPRAGKKKAPPTYRLELSYEYQVAGQTYKSDHVGFGLAISGTKETIEAKRKGPYSVGSTIPVFVNPADPAEAVLLKGPGANWVGIGVGTFFILFSLPFLFLGVSMKPESTG